MPDVTEILVAVPVMLMGATVLSTVGFGIGIATSPLLLLVVEPQTVVVVVNTVSLAVFALIIAQTRRHLRVRELLPVIAGGVLGAPIGVLVLSTLSGSALRIGITALVVLFTASLRFGGLMVLARKRSIGPLVGLSVGALLAGFGIGGPLVAVYLLAREMPSQTVRGQLSLFFLIVESVAVVGYAVSGLFTTERLALIAIVIAPVLLGYVLGAALVGRMSETRFRQSVVGVILATSFVVLAREALRLQGVDLVGARGLGVDPTHTHRRPWISPLAGLPRRSGPLHTRRAA